MSKKVTYLIGAGASFGILPLVEELPMSLNGFAQKLINEVTVLPIRQVKNFYKYRGTNWSKEETFIKMAEDVTALAKEIELLASFDTLAKRLRIRGEQVRLREIKALLTSFFLYQQRMSSISSRHDSFFASILGTSSRLPENVNVISWNYDSQMEIAYSGYINSRSDSIATSRAALGLKFPGGDNFSWSGFNLIKINGTADFGHNKLGEFALLHYAKDSTEYFEDCVLNYFNCIKDKTIQSNIKFAWDSPQYSNYIDQVCDTVKNTEVLVIIGYSFPYFNKEVDVNILKSMNTLQSIYVQDPLAENVIETIESLDAIRTIKTFCPLSSTKQFYIPPGM